MSSLLRPFANVVIERIDATNSLDSVLHRLGVAGELGAADDYLVAAMSSRVGSLLVEREFVDREFAEVYASFYARAFSEMPKRAVRLAFFDAVLSRRSLYRLERFVSSFLGIAVLHPGERYALGSAYLSASLLPEYAICHRRFTFDFFGSRLQVDASPFMRAEPTVECATSAVWMASHGNWHGDVRNVTLANIAGLQATSGGIEQSAFQRGLTLSDVVRIFRTLGFDTEVTHDPTPEVGVVLRYAVLSGVPPILIVEPEATEAAHALVVVGFRKGDTPSTALPVSWSGQSGVLDETCEEILIHDPSFGPYVPAKLVSHPQGISLHAEGGGVGDARVLTVITPWPLGVTQSPSSVRDTALVTLAAMRVKTRVSIDGPIGVRVYLMESNWYKSMVAGNRTMPKYVASVYRSLPLPRLVWVAEYARVGGIAGSEDEIIGEVLIDAAGLRPPEFLAAHLPQTVVIGREWNRWNRWDHGTHEVKDDRPYRTNCPLLA